MTKRTFAAALAALTLTAGLSACGSSGTRKHDAPAAQVSSGVGNLDLGFSIQYVQGIKCVVYGSETYSGYSVHAISCDFTGASG